MSYPKARKRLWIVQGKDRHDLDFFVIALTKKEAEKECSYEAARGGNLRIDEYVPATPEGGEER